MTGLIVNPYLVVPGVPAYTCDAADFDGTNDLISRGAMTGDADGKQILVSFWVYSQGAVAENIFAAETGLSDMVISFATAADAWVFRFPAAGGASNAILATFTKDIEGGWHHFIASCDVTDTGKRFIYVDGVAQTVTWTTYTDTNMDLTPSTWAVGANAAAAGKFDGGLAEFFFHPTYLDISVSSNLEKFRSAAGKPVNLGTDGSTPLGTQPQVYLHLDDSETANNFALNAGTGGDFTVTGALSTFASSPSD